MYCINCRQDIRDTENPCPYCGFDPTETYNPHDFYDPLEPEDKHATHHLSFQSKILVVLIWITIISFILWFLLRLLSGNPSPQIPDFGEAEFF